ncbi:carboxypeptidase-like regulatory domain-containing protein [Pontibacter arcticus]|uniref:CarboxypepD_reg-like domain-containing protein n=1 Tax=Pontibacter arcticus TaxID=2080288 RepID=A0A364RD18_9BACT|nr:carboxypeptidase-like regulatory domain-containing protein [Pontibacter arcticus]RAU82157.1 hypothetical protein DP923_10140 [Pontibacter arcticus]
MPTYPLRFLYFILLVLGPLAGLAQGTTIRLNGTILQADKKTPVEGATIIKTNSQRGVLSDKTGQFKIDVGQQDTLLIRAIGYKPVLYLPKRLPVSELRVNIILQEDSVMLGEVEITSRPSPEMIERTLRNMKQNRTSQVKRPGHLPGLDPPPPPDEPAPSIGSPIGLLYDMVSKEGKERRKLEELIKLQQLQQQEKERKNYNRFFKDNTGYE